MNYYVCGLMSCPFADDVLEYDGEDVECEDCPYAIIVDEDGEPR